MTVVAGLVGLVVGYAVAWWRARQLVEHAEWARDKAIAQRIAMSETVTELQDGLRTATEALAAIKASRSVAGKKAWETRQQKAAS